MIDAIVAGHLCLDLIPDLTELTPGFFNDNFKPGQLIQSGPAKLSTGGAVANTGLALHKLGITTRLCARLGEDPLGYVLRQKFENQAVGVEDWFTSSPESSTSYTIVINPPGEDRRFVHHPGANDDFTASDVSDEALQDVRLFHFGYPPLMAGMYLNQGEQLVSLFKRVKSHGVMTSLDMAYVDPDSPAGNADWYSILEKVIPTVDLFVPSFDELLPMLRQESTTPLSAALLSDLSGELMMMGAKLVLIKLGDRGLYFRSHDSDALRSLDRVFPDNLTLWANFEAWLPCFKVDAVGTTGSGDVTIAGFIAAVLKGLPPVEALQAALAAGASSVEAADPLSALCSWEKTWERINAGWRRCQEPDQFIRNK